MTREFVIGETSATPVRVGGNAGLTVIAGPCVIEKESMVLRVAEQLAKDCRELGIGFIFKCSYLKDNRSSPSSFVGPGIEAGLKLLAKVRAEVGVPVLSDIHEQDEVERAAEVLDVLQIPAFLCRQTRLLQRAAATGKTVNVKKGQFLAPDDMRHVIEKFENSQAGGDPPSGGLLLTERGASFGYQNLVVDFRSLEIMRDLGYPVVFDVTHSLQMPGGAGAESGGDRRFAPMMSRAAAAAGVDALFFEAHPDPRNAKSDRHTQLPLEDMKGILSIAKDFHELQRQQAAC